MVNGKRGYKDLREHLSSLEGGGLRYVDGCDVERAVSADFFTQKRIYGKGEGDLGRTGVAEINELKNHLLFWEFRLKACAENFSTISGYQK